MQINKCPFCGYEKTEILNTGFGIYQVGCPKCKARGPTDTVKQIAIQKWNEV